MRTEGVTENKTSRMETFVHNAATDTVTFILLSDPMLVGYCPTEATELGYNNLN
jgi:hypothetical protein